MRMFRRCGRLIGLLLELVDEFVAPRIEVADNHPEVLERGIGGVSVVIAVVDLLGDHGEPEQTEDLVEAPVVHRQSGSLGVVLDDLATGEHAGQIRRLSLGGEHHRVVVGLHPVRERRPQVHERVADRREFPVEHRNRPQRVVLVEDDVVDTEVSVHDRRRDIGGLRLVEPADDAGEIGHVVGPGQLVALRPARDLPRNVSGAPAEFVQPGGLGVDAVQFDEQIDDPQAQGPGLFRRQVQGGRRVGSQDRAGHAFHDVEVAAEDAVVGAHADHGRHVRVGRCELRLDAVLTRHVVPGRRLRPGRRTTQHEIAVRIPQ